MNLWAPPMVIPRPPWCTGWRRRRMPFLILVEKNRCRSLFSRLTVKTVHICNASLKSDRIHRCIYVFSEIYQFSYISQTPQLMGDKWNLSVPTRPSRCTSPRSSQFLVANHDIISLSESDREFLQKFLFDTSLPRIMGYKCSSCVSVLPCLAPRGRTFLMT